MYQHTVELDLRPFLDVTLRDEGVDESTRQLSSSLRCCSISVTAATAAVVSVDRRSLTNLANLRSIGSFPQTAVRLAAFFFRCLRCGETSPPVLSQSCSPPLLRLTLWNPNKYQLEILSSRKSTIYHWLNFWCSCLNLIKINGGMLLSMKCQ